MGKEKSLLPFILGVSALGIALAFGGIWILARYLTGRVADTKLASPRRSQQHEVSDIEADLGVPLYPGAQRQPGDPPKQAVEVPLEGSFRVTAAEFETDDSLDAVAAFYREKLGAPEEHREEHGIRFVRGNTIVVLRMAKGMVRIRVVNVMEDSR